jgi:8-oxo-dGTP pyrophosphatase MutT (NUDIX family)
MDVGRAAVRVMCVNEGPEVLLLRWHDPTDGRTVWEPPGGGIEPGERRIDTARRELREETGLPGCGPGEVEPPGILQVLTELQPGGPWAAGADGAAGTDGESGRR